MPAPKAAGSVVLVPALPGPVPRPRMEHTYRRVKGPTLPPILAGCECEECSSFRETREFRGKVARLEREGYIARVGRKAPRRMVGLKP